MEFLEIKKKYWKYDILKNGFNYRISDINCALGFSQLTKINFFLKKENKYFINMWMNSVIIVKI